MGAAWSFAAGVSVGMKVAAARDVVNDALDSVYDAADAVIGYLRTVASSAFEKLNEAAAFVKDIVIRLVRRLRGRKEAAAAARRQVKSAADVWGAPWEPRSSHQAPNMAVVLSTASSRVAGFRRLQDVKTGLPPPSSAIFSAGEPGKELALLDSVAGPAARAARRASEMMALLGTAVEAMGDSARIPEAARSCICVVLAAVGLGLEAIAAAAKDA